MNQDSLLLNLESCRNRQQRLAQILVEQEIDSAILVRPEHVQYLTGFRPASVHQAVVVLAADGVLTLSAPNAVPEYCAADEVVTFEAQWCCTLRQDQMIAALSALASVLPESIFRQRIGVEFSVNPLAQGPWTNERMVDIEPELWKLRRKKDPDELALIQRAIACTEAMYTRAREIIHPGISELLVFNELQSAAVNLAGEPLLGIGNDFQCNSAGGPPRARIAGAGELYILDLGVCYRGYYSDNCRTFSVDRNPRDEQLQAWSRIVDVLNFVEQSVHPGASAKELYCSACEMLDEYLPRAFFHHLGHGIGLFPHEAPHLNDRWDDRFEVGDTFTAEPGLYAPQLRAGIRLEQDYLVTETGVQRLTSFPLEL